MISMAVRAAAAAQAPPTSAAPADTWGIPAPAFAVGYTAVALLALATTIAWRRALWRGHIPERELTTDEIAYLAGGDRRVVVTTLTRLRADNAIEIDGDRLKRTRADAGSVDGADGDGADPPERRGRQDIDRAILVALNGEGLTSGTPLFSLYRVRWDLEAIHSRLVADRLLPGRRARLRWRKTALPLWGVVGFGVARLIAAVDPARPAEYLSAALLLVFFAALLFSGQHPPDTKAARTVLARLRERHRGLRPDRPAEWTTRDPDEAALGAALYGEEVLKALEPAYGTAFRLDDGAKSRLPRRFARGRERLVTFVEGRDRLVRGATGLIPRDGGSHG